MRLLRFPVFVVALTVFGLIDAHAATPAFTTLQPGQFREIDQNLRVNVVFVGYRTFANVNQTIFRSWLPTSYRSINQIPSRVRGEIEPTGNRFTFDYNVVSSTAAFDDAFFNYLTSIAVVKPRTIFQDFYNEQSCRSLNEERPSLRADGRTLCDLQIRSMIFEIDAAGGYAELARSKFTTSNMAREMWG